MSLLSLVILELPGYQGNSLYWISERDFTFDLNHPWELKSLSYPGVTNDVLGYNAWVHVLRMIPKSFDAWRHSSCLWQGICSELPWSCGWVGAQLMYYRELGEVMQRLYD